MPLFFPRRRSWRRIAELDDFNREIELARQNRALMNFLDSRARQTEAVSSEQVRNLLGLAGASDRREPRRPA